MAFRNRISYLQAEHAKLLEHTGNLARSLKLASSQEFPDQQKGLSGLRRLSHFFDGIAEHCHAENRVVESVYQQHLNRTECDRIAAEHRDLLHLLAEFREELRFATADRAASLAQPGMQLVNSLRAHIDCERIFLSQIAKSHCTKGRRRSQRRKGHAAAGGSEPEARTVIPYTMEPHPEL
jgi:hypothetical protein